MKFNCQYCKSISVCYFLLKAPLGYADIEKKQSLNKKQKENNLTNLDPFAYDDEPNIFSCIHSSNVQAIVLP